MDKPKEQASFITDFKKNQEKQFSKLVANRRMRLRSSLFDLPEFASSPLMSVIILVDSSEELLSLELFLEESNEDLEIILLIPEGLGISKLKKNQVDIHRFDLSQYNHSTWINQITLKSSGKVICLLTSLENIKNNRLTESSSKIKNSQNNLVWILESGTKVTGVAMTRDMYYLAHGIDELIEDVNVSLLDLMLRAEMLGGQIDGANWPRADISIQAEKNVKMGRLTVNQGLTIFTSDN